MQYFRHKRYGFSCTNDAKGKKWRAYKTARGKTYVWRRLFSAHVRVSLRGSADAYGKRRKKDMTDRLAALAAAVMLAVFWFIFGKLLSVQFPTFSLFG